MPESTNARLPKSSFATITTSCDQERQTILADKGFAKKDFESFISEEVAAALLRSDRKGEPPRFGKLGGTRRRIESVFANMKGQLSLEG